MAGGILGAGRAGGPALALLVVVSYFPALQSIERALALDPDLEIARTGLAEVRRLLAQRAQ